MQIDMGVHELNHKPIEMRSTHLQIGDVAFYGSPGQLEWLKRELADALGLVAEKGEATVAAVAE